MNKIVIDFFKNRYDPEKPILLAFSGGPDSLALLHLLIEFGRNFPLKLALAHVDHGWRKESAAEAEQIVKMAEQLQLPIHIKKLCPQEMKGNLESACREARFQFFASLCQDHGYQAVLLGHHADDVAETVLKRVLEGVTIPYLSALRPEAVLYGVKVWRPLLPVSKAQIQSWLHEKGLKGFHDKTNDDTKFLRAKFRIDILPYLSHMFGKEVSSGLCHVSEEACELRDYLDDQISSYLEQVVKGKLGDFLDLSQHYLKHRFELKYLIKQFCQQASFVLSRESVTKVAEFIIQKTANKSFVIGKGESSQILYVDRGRLFICGQFLPSLPLDAVKINKQGTTKFGPWKLVATALTGPMEEKLTDWKEVWSTGQGTVILPKDDYELASPQALQDASLLKKLSNHKVPAFLRQQIPVILKGNKVQHEFLSGKAEATNQGLKGDWIKLRISLLES